MDCDRRQSFCRECSPAAIPNCPAHLSPTAKAEWRRLTRQLVEVGVMTELDRGALAAYCQAYGRWVEAERNLRETPMLLRMPSGYIQQSPWLTIANKQIDIMYRYIGEFGLSPAARSRIDTSRSSLDGLFGMEPDEFLD